MLLSKLVEGCRMKIPLSADKEIGKVVCDSSRVEPGDMFAALRGERHDGNEFIKEALLRGAAAVVTDEDICCDGVIPVYDSDEATALIYSNYYGRPADGMRIFAVTGTNGKTSTVAAASHILRYAGVTAGVIGTAELSVNGTPVDRRELLSEGSVNMTTPDAEGFYRTLSFMRGAGCRAVALEASSHALSRKRLAGVRVDVGAFTNLTPEHLDYHKNMEDYFRAKYSLAELSERFVANCDDEYGMRIFRNCARSYGIGADPRERRDLPRELFASAKNVSFPEGYAEYDLVTGGRSLHIKTALRGEFALYNTLTAASSCILLGLDPDMIPEALSSFAGAPGRMETVFSGEGAPTAMIDYAHTPDALERAVMNVKAQTKGRLILVFGCGGDRDRSKRAPMGDAASRNADHTILTEDNSRSEETEDIIADIVPGFSKDNYEIVPDRRAALLRAVEISEEKDTILCCGKGHEKYIIDKRGKRYFDERAILVAALAEKYRTVDRQ